jgi:hypothetical protein
VSDCVSEKEPAGSSSCQDTGKERVRKACPDGVSHGVCYRRNSLRTTVVFSARIFADRVDSAASLKTA